MNEVRDLYDKPTGRDRNRWHLVPEKGVWVKRKFVSLKLPRHRAEPFLEEGPLRILSCKVLFP